MPRMYRGSINIDFTKQKSNRYQKLVVALLQSKWVYVETSAFIIETPNLAQVWRGVELVAKQAAKAGLLSAFTFHIQSSESFAGNDYKSAAWNLKDPVGDILRTPWPQP